MVYGAFTSNVDMRTGAPAFGTPESVKGAIASGQLARRYGLPWRSSNTTASNVVDAQAAYETEMAVWGAVMGGVNLLYQGAGWLEGGLTASYEKLIIDAEILQMLSEVLQPSRSTTPASASTRSPTSGRAATSSGRRHTLERYETAFYRPAGVRLAQLRDLAGRRRADGDRARQRDLEAAAGRGGPADARSAVAEALDAFVARRKREISRAGAEASRRLVAVSVSGSAADQVGVQPRRPPARG